MELLYYNELDFKPVEKQFKKVEKALVELDFKSADVKKIQNTPYYRAKLDDTNRLLFKFAEYDNKTYLLLLEVILNHAYDKSKFLRGTNVDENKFLPVTSEKEIEDKQPLVYCNSKQNRLHLLDKFISFDEAQSAIYHLPLPLIIIGSAGSGKTALSLEKLKTLSGNIAYVSLSPYLIENAQNIYFKYHYDNPHQEIDFLSFREYIESLGKPEGKELTFKPFEQWYFRHFPNTKIKEPYRLFEEMKGVLTGSVVHDAYLGKEEYLSLGIKQSIFAREQREEVYHIFEKYLSFLQQDGYYDTNILSYQYLPKVKQLYDYVVIDEVQDMTNIQLKLVLSSLKIPGNFLLSGDANQIVHPNFFSWSKIKSLFYKDKQADYNIYRILTTNYRNSQWVTDLSNKLLLIKNARFGSVDKESTYLVDTKSPVKGEVNLLADKDKPKKELNDKTQQSTRFAVLVMNNQDKQEAKKFFKTPLIFSIQEAKGLEYENIILYNFVSAYQKEFTEITRGVDESVFEKELRYMRASNKEDKDLEVYKFFINSLYVAFTRAVKNLYLIEKEHSHRLFSLLKLRTGSEQIQIETQKSNTEDWLAEARRLELQGKHEQAQEIRDRLLGIQHISLEDLETLKLVALDPSKTEQEVKRERKQLFAYSEAHHYIEVIEKLAALNFKRAMVYMSAVNKDRKEFAKSCRLNRTGEIGLIVKKFGPDFRSNENGMTGLMLGLHYGNPEVVFYFINRGANMKLSSSDEMNAAQILLRSYYLHEMKKVQQAMDAGGFKKLYDRVKQPAIRLQIEDRIIKLNNQSMGSLLLQYMVAIQKERIAGQKDFSMENFMQVIDLLPEGVLPEYRRKRQYINSILANNEIDRDFVYNKKLFKRTGRGWYKVNPELKILEGQEIS